MRCEGLPTADDADVIARLQRKVMEQARELSALRKSEASAQAELDRALLRSPSRERGQSPDRALRRRLADVEARLDSQKRAAADAAARATRAEAQLAKKTPVDIRKKLAAAEAALKSAAHASKASDADRAKACAAAAADAKTACHGRLDALESRVAHAIAAGAAKERAAHDAGRAASAAAAAAFGALRTDHEGALNDLRASAEAAAQLGLQGRAADQRAARNARDGADAAAASAAAINANAARLQVAANQVDKATLEPLRTLEEAARRENGGGNPETYAKVLENAGLRAVATRLRSLATERDTATKAAVTAVDAAEAARGAAAAATRRADEGHATHDAVARALANVISARDARAPAPPPPALDTEKTAAIAARAVLAAALDHALPAVARVSGALDAAPPGGDEALDALARRASACLHAAAVALTPAPARAPLALAEEAACHDLPSERRRARRVATPSYEPDDASLDDAVEVDAEEEGALAELGLGARYVVWARDRGCREFMYPAYAGAPPSPRQSARPSSGRLARARAHLARLSSNRAR